MATAPKPAEEVLEQVCRHETAAAVYRLQSDKDRMKLFMECVLKKEGEPLPCSRMQLLGFIPKNVPVKLLHPDVLDDIAAQLSRGHSAQTRRIAKGYPPQPSRDGKLVLLVKAFTKSSAQREVVDPWFVKTFDNIESGSSVARLYAPQAGTPGLNVLGEALPSTPGKEIGVEIDETLRLETSGTFTAVIAQTSGYLKVESGKLGIIHELIINGDVDHQCGDIQFVGKVTVRGTVKKLFRVSAREDIVVHGDVQDGSLSSGGNITVKGHVTGETLKGLPHTARMPLQQRLRMADSRKAQIICGGVFHASLLDGVSIDSVGDIEVEKEVRGSYLRTRGTVRIPKGRIIGGETYAVCGVDADILGADLQAVTDIHLCSDRESSAEFAVLQEKLKAHETAEEMLRLYLGPYADTPARIRTLNSEHRKKMENLRAKLEEVLKGKNKLLEQKSLLIADEQLNVVFRVNVNKLAHPGVRITAEDAHYVLHESINGPKSIEYFPADKKFDVIDQQPLQCVLHRRK